MAHVPSIPGCVTQGDTVEQALAMAQDAAEGRLSIMAEDGESLPIETPGAVISSIEVSVPDLVLASAQAPTIEAAR